MQITSKFKFLSAEKLQGREGGSYNLVKGLWNDRDVFKFYVSDEELEFWKSYKTLQEVTGTFEVTVYREKLGFSAPKVVKAE